MALILAVSEQYFLGNYQFFSGLSTMYRANLFTSRAEAALIRFESSRAAADMN